MANNSTYIWDMSGIDCTCDVLDKEESRRNYIRLMFNRTAQMFEYDGLPDTIPAYMLERILQINGHVCFTEVKGQLYALNGNFGGAPDPYYRPTLYVVANPALEFTGSLKILNFLEPAFRQTTQGKCVVMKNDTQAMGILYLCKRFAAQLAENDISIRSAQINARHQVFISAATDAEIASANAYIKGIEAGKPAAVLEKAFLDGIKTADLSTQGSNMIIQLIELQQYLKASWFNEIGLNANFNMKREYMSEEELRESTDILLPLIDDMLRNREEALSVINSTYGTNITVKKNSAWNNKQQEVNTEQELKEAEVASMTEDTELDITGDNAEPSKEDHKEEETKEDEKKEDDKNE